MARTRLDLDQKLKILVSEYQGHLYFSPPDGAEMEFPCIVYEYVNANQQHADNIPYLTDKRYQLTVIDRDPDGELKDRVLELPKCSPDRSFVSGDLNHHVYTLFF